MVQPEQQSRPISIAMPQEVFNFSDLATREIKTGNARDVRIATDKAIFDIGRTIFGETNWQFIEPTLQDYTTDEPYPTFRAPKGAESIAFDYGVLISHMAKSVKSGEGFADPLVVTLSSLIILSIARSKIKNIQEQILSQVVPDGGLKQEQIQLQNMQHLQIVSLRTFLLIGEKSLANYVATLQEDHPLRITSRLVMPLFEAFAAPQARSSFKGRDPSRSVVRLITLLEAGQSVPDIEDTLGIKILGPRAYRTLFNETSQQVYSRLLADPELPLEEQQRYMVIMEYFRGSRTPQEIGELFKLSTEDVNKIIKEEIAGLREYTRPL